MKLIPNKVNSYLVFFQKDDLYSYLAYEGDALVFKGNMPIDESAKIFANVLNNFLNSDIKYKIENDNKINK